MGSGVVYLFVVFVFYLKLILIVVIYFIGEGGVFLDGSREGGNESGRFRRRFYFSGKVKSFSKSSRKFRGVIFV